MQHSCFLSFGNQMLESIFLVNTLATCEDAMELNV